MGISRGVMIAMLGVAALGAHREAVADDNSPPLDPGLRPGAPDAGGPLAGLNSIERSFFYAARKPFRRDRFGVRADAGRVRASASARATISIAASGCHAFPAAGRSSPPVNPQIAMATLDGARNVVPSFIAADGPVREARFVNNPDGSPDGGVP